MKDQTNICIGKNAGVCLTTGHHNILIGETAGRNFTTESYMLIFGGIRHQMSGEDEYYSYLALLENVINSYRRYAIAQNIIPCSTGSNSTILGESSYYITLGYSEYMKSPGNKVVGMFSTGETTTGNQSGPWGTAQGIAGDNASNNTTIGYTKLTDNKTGTSSWAFGNEDFKKAKEDPAYAEYIKRMIANHPNSKKCDCEGKCNTNTCMGKRSGY